MVTPRARPRGMIVTLCSGSEPGEKAAILAHLRGLWRHLQRVGIPFKAHWGKINFVDAEFARRNHDVDRFLPLVSPMFMNRYLEERLPC